MDKGKNLQGFSRILDDREEYLVDRDRGVCDPFLSVGSVSVSKERLWQYNSQGNDILNAYKSFLYNFSIEQTLHFPEFAKCAQLIILLLRELLSVSPHLGYCVKLMPRSSAKI